MNEVPKIRHQANEEEINITEKKYHIDSKKIQIILRKCYYI